MLLQRLTLKSRLFILKVEIITANEAKVMVERIHEIRDMDKSNLTKNERAELRKELKDMKQSIRKDGGYIVIGTGTLVLIIILILLLT